MRLSYFLPAAAIVFLFPVIGRAQAIGGGSLFQPEVDIVNSGVILDTQATVSADRKYVTMTMRPQNSQLLALKSFTFQTGGPANNVNGLVGGGGGAAGGMAPNNSTTIPARPAASQTINAPMRLAPGAGAVLLSQRGITPIVRE